MIGGPHGDSGLTGRKIIVDTYGGYARHGGGAFSGKDCTKVDRSAAYAARYVAKNIVAAGLADKCEIQLSYAIGVAQPTSVMVDTFGTGKLSDEKITEIVRENFDLRPAGIIKMLDLRRPIYKQTAAYGHFGRNDLDLPWEKLDKVDALKNICNLIEADRIMCGETKKENSNQKQCIKMVGNIGILYEDPYILVCRKPAGVPVQSANARVKDMVSILKLYLLEESGKPGEPYLELCIA